MQTREERVDGPEGRLAILRDEWGIPHVRASSAHDAFFGQGFVQAEDRLGQLECDRRRAYGAWAEVAGPSAVSFDVFARRCGLRAAARREYGALPADARDVLDAYAAGVNAYLSLRRPLPTDLALAGVEPEPWEPWDSNAVFLVRHVVFANWQKKLWRARVARRLGADGALALERDDRPVPLIVPPGATGPPYALDPADLGPVGVAVGVLADADPASFGELAGGVPTADEGGSNSWVLSGARTATGKPLLAGDPHRTVEVPGVYVQNHLACPEFDAVGLAFVGVPGLPHFGHNRRVAWCITNANGDYQDLFVERFPPGDPAQVATAGGWQPVQHRVEEVRVRGGESVRVDCYETGHGPVVLGDPARGAAVALRSTALASPSGGLGVLAPMLRSAGVGELLDVMRDWVDPVNSFLCADVDGSVAYHTVGVVPTRVTANAWGPVPGWTGAHEWGGPVAFDDLPAARDPDSGVIVTANQRIVGPEYPHHLGDAYARPDRAERLHARLASLRAATVDDMAAVHRDVVSLRAPLWVERLTALTPRDEHERAAQAILREWDGAMDADSAGAAVCMVVRDAVCRRLVHGPGLGRLRAPLADEPPGAFVPAASRLWPVASVLLARDDPTLLPAGRRWSDVLADGLADGVAVLRATAGDDPARWRWGALHVSAPRHPLSPLHPEWEGRLDPPAVEVAGEWDTVLASSHAVGSGFAVTGASVARYVFAVGDWDRSRWIVPLGASGDPESPHFADQRAGWAAGELVPMRYGWDGIEREASARTDLAPR